MVIMLSRDSRYLRPSLWFYGAPQIDYHSHEPPRRLLATAMSTLGAALMRALSPHFDFVSCLIYPVGPAFCRGQSEMPADFAFVYATAARATRLPTAFDLVRCRRQAHSSFA